MSESIETYLPRPGSTGDRAMSHLRAMGRTEANELADAIDCFRDALAANLKMCLVNGLVIADTVDGRTFYDLPEPMRFRSVGQTVVDDLLGRMREGSAEAPAQQPEESAVVHEIVETPAAEAPPPAPKDLQFNCALYARGEFVIVCNGVTVVLDPDEFEQLTYYIRRHT